MDPCLYFVEYSPDVLKNKTKVVDIFITDKKGFMKINIELSPPEIWIRISFHNRSGSPSLHKRLDIGIYSKETKEPSRQILSKCFLNISFLYILLANTIDFDKLIFE